MGVRARLRRVRFRIGEWLGRRLGGHRPALTGRFDPAWNRWLYERDPHWPHLAPDERERMELLVGSFMTTTRWEAARGFRLDMEMEVLIAAQACVLLLGLDHDDFGGPSRVIVHPSTVVLHGQRSIGVGVVQATGPYHVLGQAHYRGPVLLSWGSVRSGARFPGRGQNVVYHEFAHQLDMLDGTIDGTPPLADQAARDRWVEVCTAAYDEVRTSDTRDVLRPYAGTNPGEFFAVATEVFFTRPHELRNERDDLYRELVGYYRQDPAGRLPEPESGPSAASDPR